MELFFGMNLRISSHLGNCFSMLLFGLILKEREPKILKRLKSLKSEYSPRVTFQHAVSCTSIDSNSPIKSKTFPSRLYVCWDLHIEAWILY